MTLRLTVHEGAWREHVDVFAASVDGLVPVVKGNGYGFGRELLAPIAAGLGPRVAIGTLHELDGAAGAEAWVLTPTMEPPGDVTAILTVGSLLQVQALDGWRGRVVVKLRSSMRRYGASPDELTDVICAVERAGLDLVGAALHLPIAGDDEARRAEIEAWLPMLPADVSLSVSHLAPASFAALCQAHPGRRFDLRCGTALWHGDKSFLHLGADVIDRHPVRAGDTAGYHATMVRADGHLVVIGAGSAHGVAPLADGSSPFHHGRRRMPLLEPPHMHTSMVFVATGDPLPEIGQVVDVQRPLIVVSPDEVSWQP